MKIILAPSSFKGSLSNIEAVDIMQRASLQVFPDSELISFPLADGGEGTIEVIKKLIGGDFVFADVAGPFYKKIKTKWLKKDDTAFIEMAQASGLTLIPKNERNPLLTTTFGVGELIKKAISSECRKIFIGVGGSATNDGGIGALTALGVKFKKDDGSTIFPGCGKDLITIRKIETKEHLSDLKDKEIVILSDVKNFFYGKQGAAYIYSPQKGADKKDVRVLDSGLRNFAQVIKGFTGKDIADMPGAGAAGGIAGGFAAFLNAKIVSGTEVILKMGRFEEKLKRAELVIAGEGRVDSQTFSGKALGVVAALCKEIGTQLLILAGSVEDGISKNPLLEGTVIERIAPKTASVEESMKNVKEYLYKKVIQMLTQYKSSSLFFGIKE